MQDIKPSTNNENFMIVKIQEGLGSLPNGIIGCQTLSDIYIMLCNLGVCEWEKPITLSIYGQSVIIAKDIIVCDPNSSVKPYENSISGSFTYPSSDKPCSILINNGKDVFSYACHATIPSLKKPEGVIARYTDGTFWMGRCMSTADIPNRRNVDWAVGGMTLGKNYSPVSEGFSGAYADVLRNTNHTVLGVKNHMIYLVYVANMNGGQIQDLITNKMQFEMALLLDGGHIAAINGTESFAEKNMNQYQGYIIQGI